MDDVAAFCAHTIVPLCSVVGRGNRSGSRCRPRSQPIRPYRTMPHRRRTGESIASPERRSSGGMWGRRRLLQACPATTGPHACFGPRRLTTAVMVVQRLRGSMSQSLAGLVIRPSMRPVRRHRSRPRSCAQTWRPPSRRMSCANVRPAIARSHAPQARRLPPCHVSHYPAQDKANVTLTAIAGQPFGTGPGEIADVSPNDVHPEQLGHCNLLAPRAAVVRAKPDSIRRLITTNSDRTYSTPSWVCGRRPAVIDSRAYSPEA